MANSAERNSTEKISIYLSTAPAGWKTGGKVGAKKNLYRLVKVSRQLALPTAPGLVARADGHRCEATPL
jgi:hypothetical protein